MGEYTGKRAKTRDQLIRAGMTVVAEGGVENFAISDVAARAGVVAATFYNHFQNRADFTAALARELAGEVHLGAAAIRALEGDQAGRVALAVMGIVRRAETDRTFGAAFVAFAIGATDLTDRLREATRETLVHGVSSGRFDIEVEDGALEDAVDAVFGATLEAVRAQMLGRAHHQSAMTIAVLVLKLLGLTTDEAARVVGAARRVGATVR